MFFSERKSDFRLVLLFRKCSCVSGCSLFLRTYWQRMKFAKPSGMPDTLICLYIYNPVSDTRHFWNFLSAAGNYVLQDNRFNIVNDVAIYCDRPMGTRYTLFIEGKSC